MRVAFEDERMCIRTRCRDTEQLIGTLKPFVCGTSLFVSALATRPVGTEAPFEVSLLDGTVVMRGHGVIREIWNNTDNRFQRAGILVAIRALTKSSKVVFDRMRGSQPVLEAVKPQPPASPREDDAAFVTDSGTWLGRPVHAPAAGMWTEETDAFLEVLRAIPAREHVDNLARARRSTQSVPVKVTIPPRGARGDDAKPRIETAPLAVVAVPRVVTQDRFSKVSVPDVPPEPAAPEATPDETSAATTDPFFLPNHDHVPTERNPRPPTISVVPPVTPVVPATGPVLPANPLTSLSDLALAGYVDCSIFESTAPTAVPSAAPEPTDAYEASVPSLRPASRAFWWPLVALACAAAVVVMFYTRVQKPSAAPARAHAATFDLEVLRRPGTEEPNHMTFDVVVTPMCEGK